jgi:UDP-N-acetyl-2-amino-2-deoxyglucuronate dehydrogenase
MSTAAVIGCGDVSTVHLEAIDAIDDVELVAVVDPDPDARRAAAARWGVPAYADTTALLAAVRPGVAHVCTPHDQHLPVALELLGAGVHVLTEKPLAHTLADAERFVAAAEASSARTGVCFQNRYNVAAQEAHRILASGELGTVLGAAAAVPWTRTRGYYQDKPWRGRWASAGGGLLINQAIHTLDLVQWLVGDVVGVSGHASTRLYGDLIEVEDTAEMLLTHASGARSLFYGSLANVVHAPVSIEVTATRGSLTIRADLTVTYADGRTEVVEERKAPSGGRAYWGVSHELLIRDFHAALGDDEPFWLSPRAALAPLRVLTEVYAQSGLGPARTVPDAR